MTRQDKRFYIPYGIVGLSKPYADQQRVEHPTKLVRRVMEALDIEISPFEYDPTRDFSIRRNDISVKLSGVPESFEDYFRMKAKDTTYPEPSFFVNVASEHIGIIRGERGKLVDELRRILLGEFYGKEVPILVMVKPEPESVQRIKPKLRLSSSHA